MPETDTVFPLVINGSNLDETDPNKSKYVYSFPVGSVYFPKGSRVAIGSISMYYSWFNITSAYGNNAFNIIWPVGAGTTTYNVTIPNGSYSVDDLNAYIQSFCITNGLYLINGSGNFVYYLSLSENPTNYSVQLNCFGIPTSLPVGWTAPAGWPGYPTTGFTPQLQVLANAFRSTIGFNAGSYPPTQQTATYSKTSDFTPQISPVQSVIVSSNLCNNLYNTNPQVLYTFSPSGTAFGNVITANPSFPQFVPIQSGNYNTISIQFLAQDGSTPLQIQDTNLTVMLLLKVPE